MEILRYTFTLRQSLKAIINLVIHPLIIFQKAFRAAVRTMGTAWTTTSSIFVFLVFTYLTQNSLGLLDDEKSIVRLFEDLAKKNEFWISQLLKNSKDFTPNRGLGRQYGILYIPSQPVQEGPDVLPKRLPTDVVVNMWDRNAYIFPINRVLDADVKSSFVITVPHRPPGYRWKLHTEAQFINSASFLDPLSDIYTRMMLWYRTKNIKPTEVYMYTYYAPCRHCVDKIISFLGNKDNEDVTLIVGYSSMEWNVGDGKGDKINYVNKQTRDLALELQGHNNGSLVHVPRLGCGINRNTNKIICGKN